jgi:Phage integrase family.
MKLDIDFFVEALEGERKQVRELVDFAFKALQHECERALSAPTNLPKNYFARAAQNVYSYAKSDNKLNALRTCLFALYEYCLTFNPELAPPAARHALKQIRTVIHDDSPPFALIEALKKLIEQELPKKRLDELPCALIALLLCRHSTVRSEAQLRATLDANLNDLIIFKDAQFAALTTSKKRFLLDAVAIQAFKILKSRTPEELTIPQLSSQLKFLLRAHTEEMCSLLQGEHKFSHAISVVSFMNQAIAATTFDDVYSQLNETDFVRAITGQHAPRHYEGKNAHQTQRKKKRTTKAFLNLEKLTELFEHNRSCKLAFDARTSSADSEILDVVRKVVQAFARADKKQRRNTAAFKHLKAKLIATLSKAYSKDSEVSLTALAIATYISDLAIHGSNFKDKLAMSTIESYLSTLTVFAKIAWCDEQLQREAQDSVTQLEDLTEAVATSLTDLPDPGKQGTALGFLQYLSQATRLKFFDPVELEYWGAGSIETRMHYVCKQDLNKACNTFLSKSNIAERRQFVLFVQLSYALGLRRKEAALLEIDDVNFKTSSIYVSHFVKRKTKRAVRRIPTSLLTVEIESKLSAHINERARLGHSTVFDEPVLSALNDEFLSILRLQCNNDALVIHSLRHSAASNLVILFDMCSTPHFRDYRIRLYFLRNEIFSDEQLHRIKRSLESLGKSTNIFFPSLDTAAQLLGHVSPCITAQSYLHLLDVLFFLQDTQRSQPPSPKLASSLFTQSNYRFEFKKLYDSHFPDVVSCNALFFKSFTRGLTHVRQLSIRDFKSDSDTSLSQEFTFSDYLKALKLFKESSHCEIEQSLRTHFEQCSATLNIEFLCAKAFTTKNRAWLQLLEKISSTNWNTMNRRAIQTLREIINDEKIRSLRTADRYLRAIRLLLLNDLTIALHVPSGAKTASAWEQLIEKYGYSTLLVTKADVTTTAIGTKPVGLCWPLWRYLADILIALNLYLTFQSRNKDIHTS